MSLVAVIDDRQDVRNRLAKRIKRYIDKNDIKWDVEDFDPLPQKEDYLTWVIEKKVVVLIVDEKLKEQRIGAEFNTYDGHDLVETIRSKFDQLPIYIITAVADDPSLEDTKGNYEDIISRTVFEKDDQSEKYMQRIVRQTQSYLTNFQKEYSRLTELSELVAMGKASKEDLEELKALQAKIHVPLSSYVDSSRMEWISELDKKTKELEALSSQIEAYLRDRKDGVD